jgi:hypothetical protein
MMRRRSESDLAPNSGPEAPMLSVEIKVKQAEFSHIINAMREWLDHNRCNLLQFRHQQDGEVIVVSATFALTDEASAAAFRQQFDGATA